MISDISELTKWASFWDAVSVWSAIFVFIGVVGESVADFDILARWTRLAERETLRHKIAKAGLLILIAALAIEVIAAIGSHNVNADIISTLNGKLSETITQATELENLTETLRLSNEELKKETKDQSEILVKTRGELDDLGKESLKLEDDVRAQKKRDERALGTLKADEDRLMQAQESIKVDAGKAANAAKTADTALVDMNKTVADIQAMRARLSEILSPRQIDDAHFAQMVSALKQFPETPVDFALTRDAESGALLVRITDLIKAANWKIQAWQGGGLGLQTSARPDLPNLGDVTRQGLQITISESDRDKLEKPAQALFKNLSQSGIQGIIEVVSDKAPDGKPNPIAVLPGTIHVIVGAKS